MDLPEKSEKGSLGLEVPLEAPPPAYTPQASSSSASEVNDERNSATIPSTTGPKKVYTTYHVYSEQNYLRKAKAALVKHLNSNVPSYTFEFPEDGERASKMIMRGASTTQDTTPSPLATGSFEKSFGKSTVSFTDGRTASISVVPRADQHQKVRLFRVDIQNSPTAQFEHPATMFWEMGTRNHGTSKGGVDNFEFMDEERRVHAVLLTGFHKSMKKLERLHWLIEPQGGMVDMSVGTLLAVWKKAERDVRSGHIGLTV